MHDPRTGHNPLCGPVTHPHQRCIPRRAPAHDPRGDRNPAALTRRSSAPLVDSAPCSGARSARPAAPRSVWARCSPGLAVSSASCPSPDPCGGRNPAALTRRSPTPLVDSAWRPRSARPAAPRPAWSRRSPAPLVRSASCPGPQSAQRLAPTAWTEHPPAPTVHSTLRTRAPAVAVTRLLVVSTGWLWALVVGPSVSRTRTSTGGGVRLAWRFCSVVLGASALGGCAHRPPGRRVGRGRGTGGRWRGRFPGAGR